MVSVLIPLYNEENRKLVSSLLQAFTVAGTQGEIVISDVSSRACYTPPTDHSDIPIRYYHHELTKSRSQNRNFLAEKATFSWLIFLDCDAELPDNLFIKRYLDLSDKEAVICGGTAYQSKIPADKRRILRWKYGKKREVIPAESRQLHPYNSFSSFNFCLPKKIFAKIKFNEEFNQYGHEDTYFGFELEIKKVPIIHITNPLIHLGLDASDAFIEKTEAGIESLKRLQQSGLFQDEFLSGIKLWRVYSRLQQKPLLYLLKLLAMPLKRMIRLNLKSGNPSIALFDLYKLLHLAKIQD